MKTILIIIFISSLVAAQNFFPSQLNNKYQIKGYNTSSGPGGGGVQSSTRWFKEAVKSDTIIEGKRFINFIGYSEQFNHHYFYHYDSIEQKLFIKIPYDDTIRLAVDFNVPAGDTIISYITGEPLEFESQGISEIYLFGEPFQAFQMDYYSIYLKRYRYEFTDRIGVSHYYKFAGNMFSQGSKRDSLRSAIIDTIVYNPIYLNITSLSPLINRPVNAFPFVLSGTYSTNVNLIDTFYVKAKLVRDEDTISTYTYGLSNGFTYLNILPQAGDKLLLKAFISDSSIFSNYDTYPDTGYAEILVLPAITDAFEDNISFSFKLDQNYPNPFNPVTSVQYQISTTALVKLIVYDIMGNEVAILVNEEKPPGIYTAEFNGSALSSGVYFYKLTAGDKTEIKKMMMMK